MLSTAAIWRFALFDGTGVPTSSPDSSPSTDALYFKGGYVLRHVYGYERFSKDIDC
jgi:Nucleotidyl transferase AbiEii toxin, Type IV TA system